MPQVKGGQKGKASSKSGPKGNSKKEAPARDAVVKQTADASSIIMGVFFLVALLVGAAAWMGQSISVVETKANELADGAAKTFGLSVKSIQIIEVTDEQEAVIRRAMSVREGDSMFRADPAQIKDRIDTLKGFGNVQVHRFWPNQITVVVTPLETSVLFRETEAAPLKAVHITGEEAAEIRDGVDYHLIQGDGALPQWPALLDDLQRFPALETRLDYAERIGERRWDLIMASGTRAKLPADDAIEPALEVLAALHRATGILDRQVKQIDLRDPARVYVQRQETEFALADIGGAG
ncbi:MAG: hypothetical protein CMK09_06045 [Ponticaulis sp.]|nr:hypothetical protein [Ponticaulis sp.]|tara:strand:- start:16230 stop:17111 length:882 start_codon:yes stop_codon:yes gene_type:complete